MEPLWKLQYLLEPSSLVLISTAVLVVFASAQRALTHEREAQRHRDFADTSITLDGSQAVMIPLASSCSLLLMFYLFSSISQLITVLTTGMAVASFAFCVSPYVVILSSHLGFLDPLGKLCCFKSIDRAQALVVILSGGVVVLWLISGHWLLNNVLGIAICIGFVTHIRLPNVRVCTLLLSCLFVYDIFWVFLSERFFGENVMVSVATQQASNPVHTVANRLNLPGLQSITKKLEMPVKIVFPRHLLGGVVPSANGMEFMMLGLGDMAIPGMLLALVLCFDHRKGRIYNDLEPAFVRNHKKYIWYALLGYACGLVCALSAGLLTRSPQPALLYLVPSTLGPVMFAAWMKSEFNELWNGPRPVVNDKSQLMVV